MIRRGNYSPFGRMRISAGIMSVDIIPYASDMVPPADAHNSQRQLSSRWSDVNWRRYNVDRHYTITNIH